MSIRETYDLQLENLSEEFIRMGAAARQAVQQAVDALKNSDIAELSTHIRPALFPTLLPHILQLAETVSKMTDDAIRAYVQEDLALAGEVIDRDDTADEAFCAIKREIAQDMAGNPAGVDAALDCLMVAKYLERVGDHAVNICEWVQFYKTGIHKHERIV